MNNDSTVLIPKINPTAGKTDFDDTVVEAKKGSRSRKIIYASGIFLAVLIVFVIPVIIFFIQAKKIFANIEPIIEGKNYQNVDQTRNDFKVLKKNTNDLKGTFKLISWMKLIPFVGTYVSDLGNGLSASVKIFEAGEVAFTTLDPLLLELGYGRENGEANSSEKSAQERIDFVVNSIPKITPKIDEISEYINEAQVLLSEIDPNDYPETIKGISLKEKLIKFLNIFNQVSKYVTKSKPLFENAQYFLGMDNERKYLILFQNDKELRATGGFLTAYSIMKVRDAKFEPVTSDDIYNLDSKYKPNKPAPQAIVDLIKGPYVLSQNIRLRDINYSPDFKVSMDLFSAEASKIGLSDVDGIIAVDTQLLVNLLDVLGEIGVPGFGNFSSKNDSRCNCPQVVYELESFADVEGPIIWDPVTGKIILRPPNSDNRKKIIGPLMNSVLANAMAQPKEKLPDLINSIFKSVSEKHVLFYMLGADYQKVVEDFGIAGRVVDYQEDYLHINDSNLGGRKSNLYLKIEVEQEIDISKDGLIQKTVNLTYRNPEKHDGWLNSVLPNWVRVYVPNGSQLIKVSGLEKEYPTMEDMGKTVFSGYFKLRPEGVSKISFTYLLPFKIKKGQEDLKMLIQKQPGLDTPLYVIKSSNDEMEFLLNTDKEIQVRI